MSISILGISAFYHDSAAAILVDGEILMEERVVKTVDEAEVLGMAQRETEAAIDRNNLKHLMDYTAGYWGRSRY